LVRRTTFVDFPNLLQACLEDSAETSTLPFEEILKMDSGKDQDLWARQMIALRILVQLDPSRVNSLVPFLKKNPRPEIRRFLQRRGTQRKQEIINADPGSYELVLIPSGEFMMGSPDSEKERRESEGLIHRVSIPEFYMGRYPVTNREYSQFLKENPGVLEPKYWADRRFNQENQPVVGVSWNDAQKYAEWAGLQLPSEAQWEYACRAGTTTRFYPGNEDSDLDEAGWSSRNSKEQLQAVGQKEPNSFGLCDMHGNVWEWVEDNWHGSYAKAPSDGSAWIDEPRGSLRVVRGGSWFIDARYCRSATRLSSPPDDRWYLIGFRLSRSVSLDS
jgi:formylglycine-generating enzyme required for sulfatase activity